MSRVEEGTGVTAAYVRGDARVMRGTARRCGPVAFLWHNEEEPVGQRTLLLPYDQEGETWARTEDPEAVAALIAYRKLTLSVQP